MKQTLRKHFILLSAFTLSSLNLLAQNCQVTATAAYTNLCPGATTEISSSASFTATAWEWYKEGEATPVGNAASLLVSAAGRYKVVATGGGCSAVTSNTVEVTATALPGAGSISGQSTICAGAEALYQISPQYGAEKYSWSVPAGWTIVGGQNTTQLRVIAGSNSGLISVYAMNACGTGESATLAVQTIITPAAPANIAGPNSFCNAGQEANYSIEPVSGATSYTWTVPSGWEIRSGQGTATISVVVGKGGKVTVAAENQCGTSAPRVLVVNTPESIAAPTVLGNSVCAGEQALLQVNNPQPGLTYTWYSSETSSTALATGTSFSTPALTASTTYYVAASTTSGCASMRTAFTAEVTPAITNNTLAEAPALCMSDIPATLQGTAASGGTGVYLYQWQKSTDGTQFIPISGASSANYTPIFLEQTTWFRRVVASGSCQSVSNSIKVTVHPIPAKPTVSFSESKLTANEVAAGYEWLKNGLVLHATTQSLSITEPGFYQVRVQNEAGCFSPLSDSLFVEFQPISDTKEAPVSIYPNPSLGSKITLKPKQQLHNVQLSVLNSSGTALYSTSLPEWKDALEMNLQHLPQGLYFIYIISTEMQSTQRLMLRH